MQNIEADILIIGCGPAGAQAAIHASRKKAKVVVVGRKERSSLNKAHIENYYGVDGKADGAQLLEIGIRQAERFGAEVVDEDLVKLEKSEGRFKALTENHLEITAKAVIFAIGIQRKKLGVKGEKEFLGAGVSYCADCDCNFFRGVPVAVIGDESAAASAAILLKDYASRVYLVSPGGLKIGAEIEKELKGTDIERIDGIGVEEILGDQRVKALKLKDGKELEVTGVFIELGSKGAIELAIPLDVFPDPSGHIKVDRDFKAGEGIFACGDITGGPYQIAKAVGEGCVAGMNAADYAKSLGKQ